MMNELTQLVIENVATGKIDRSVAAELLKKILKSGGEKHHKDIAIIGIAVRLPLADSKDDFWNNLKDGKDCIRTFPETRRPDGEVFIKHLYGISERDLNFYEGGYLEEVDKFDYGFFKLSPKEASLMDPHQRMFLQTAWEAIEDAGYGGKKLAGTRTGVYLGYNSERFYGQLVSKLEPMAASISVAGNMPHVTAARIAYLLDLKGPSLLVDTSCSSSLVAVHLACQSIKNGECEQAIAGGVKISFAPVAGKHEADIKLVSDDKRTRVFDDNSDGTAWGEGVAAILLKPLDKALKDRDSIYAVIKGSTVNHDGKSAGVSAPNALGQAEAIISACKDAEVDVETITYLEAHGIGTVLGDSVEIDGICKVFGKNTNKKQFCAIGSLKTNLGHLDSASGIAGLIKAVLALKHGMLPPSLHFQKPNSMIRFEHSPVYFNDRLVKWDTDGKPRRCGVSAHGFSGTNCHIVLEEAPGTIMEESIPSTGQQVLAISANSMDSLKRLVQKYVKYVNTENMARLQDICYTANTGRGHYCYRLVMAVKSPEDLKIKLSSLSTSRIEMLGLSGVYFGSFKIAPANKEELEIGECTESEIRNISRQAAAKLKQYIDSGRADEVLLGEICQLYVKGADIAWKELYTDGKSKREWLPVYPFERKRCWIEVPDYMDEALKEASYENKPKQLPDSNPQVTLTGRLNGSYSETECKIAKIWAQVLGVPEIGVYDNFYDLGGDSIIAAKIANMVNKNKEITLSPAEILKHASIASIADHLTSKSLYNEAKPEESAHQFNVLRAEKREYYPVSSPQMRLFILNNMNGGTRYNMPFAMLVEGKLDIEKLEKAFSLLVQRHEVFRTSFQMIDGNPVQRIYDEGELKINIIEIKEDILEEQEYADEIKNLMNRFIKPFELDKAPLVRVGLAKLGEEKYLLMLDIHHIISDGVSTGILTREFIELYRGDELPGPQFTYKDYALLQQEASYKEALKKQEEYWINRFQGEIPILDMPLDFRRPSVQDYQGANIRFKADSILTDKLKKLASNTGSTLYMVLLGVYYLLLYKYTGQEDIVVGSPVAGRPRAEFENVMGMFVNTLAMRNFPCSCKSFLEFLKEVRESCYEAYDNQDYQFEELIEKLVVKRDLSRNPLFDTMFVLQNMGIEGLELDGLKFTACPFDSMETKFDIVLGGVEEEGELLFSLEYAAVLFRTQTIERMGEHFIRLLEEVASNPEKKLCELDMLTKAEKEQILVGFNDTQQEYPRNKTLHHIFEEQVAKTPDRIAAVFGNEELTYAQLNAKANMLSRLLMKKGVKGDSIVGMMTERSLEMIIGIMGILKAGGAYLPISPSYPKDRIEYMLSDSGAGILLTQESIKDMVDFKGEIVCIDNKDIYTGDWSNPNSSSSPDYLAYVIYTSGSTGKPKGAMIEHFSIVNRLHWMNKKYPLGLEDVILQKTPYTFDVSVWELLWWSFAGSKVCFLPPGEEKDPTAIAAAIEKYKITTIHFVPSMLNIFMDYIENWEGQRDLSSLRRVFASGEALAVNQVERFNKLLAPNNTVLINLYGPTEAAVDVTYFDCPSSGSLDIVPIGKPIDNIKMYVLDKHLNLQPVGIPGELYISGDGVGRGYLNRPDLTREKFIQDPFTCINSKVQRMYKTGDLARWMLDGNIEYLGRTDFQVKIRGFRIEPGEIEAKLIKHDAVKEALVIAVKNNEGEFNLCAYLVCYGKIDVPVLRRFLLEDLPEYMVPAYFVQLGNMPLSPNGKIDRKALPEPEGQVKTKFYVPPCNDTEAQLKAIWQDLLGITNISVNDDFFELGGHSLKAMMLVSRIHKVLAVDIPLREVFRAPTIRKLALYVKSTEKSAYASISPAKEQEFYPVSSAQKRLYMLQLYEGGGTNYNMPIVAAIEGSIDADRLEMGFKTLILRHEALRTSFITYNGEPVQRIHSDAAFRLERFEASEVIARELAQDMIKPFKLEDAPLLRAGIIQINENRCILICDMHHIISDGVSMNILMKELVNAYKGSGLPELRLQYKDFSTWQDNLSRSGEMEFKEKFWVETLSGEIPVLALPTDYPRPVEMEFKGDAIIFTIDSILSEKLNRRAYINGSTLYMVMLAAFNVLLFRCTGQEDILVGSPVAGRRHADLENIIGIFLNTVVFRNRPMAEKTFVGFLEEVKENCFGVFANQEYPFEMLLDKLNVKRDLGRPPLFDVMFNLLNMNEKDNRYAAEEDDFKILPYDVATGQAKFDLTVYLSEKEGMIEGGCTYRTALFKKSTVEYLMSQYVKLLTEITEQPEKLLKDYRIFDRRELPNVGHRVCPNVEFDIFEKEAINQSIVKRFEEQVDKYSEKLAVKTVLCELTYKSLNEKANRIAHTIVNQYSDKNRLSIEEKIRYKRQMSIEGWGIKSQEKLKGTAVFAAGAGGSGSPLIHQLALCGTGTIIICDHDTVELSNLNRQFLHDESRIGMNKALSAKMTVNRINPHINVIAHPEKITRENVSELVGDAEIIYDNVDDLETKFILSEYAVKKGIPHIISSMIDINSYAAVLYPPHSPCFHCLYDRSKLEEINEIKALMSGYQKMPSPVASPSLFASTGIACNEALKILLGFASPAYNKYFLINQRGSKEIVETSGYRTITYPFSKHFKDICKEQGFDWNEGWRGNFLEEINIKPDPDCPVCGNQKGASFKSLEGIRTEIGRSMEYCADTSTYTGNSTGKKVNPKTVAILLEHDMDMITGIMGVLKSGKVYVPLDPTYPEDRLAYMLEDSEARLLLTNHKNLNLAQRLIGRVNENITILNIGAIDEHVDNGNLNIEIDPYQPAYILYTSGSTGKAKGVVQNHRNVLHFIRNYTNNLHIHSADRLTLFSSYSFDAAVMDIFGALLNGATLYPYSIKEEGSLKKLSNWLVDEEITIFHSIPTVYRYFLDTLTGNEQFTKIRLVVMGGEAVVKRDVELYKKHFSDDCIFINGLGPTESTVTLQYFIGKQTEIACNSVPVGYPVDDTTVLLLNSRGEEASVYEIGEIVYKSEHLALGYWNLPEKTSEVFVTDPISGEGRTYRSGDLGRMLTDGSIEFLGRNDFQVKVRGYRIELGEIEAVMDKMEGIKKSAAATFKSEDGESYIAAFYTVRDGACLDEDQVKASIQKELPGYMVPSRIIKLDRLPYTPSGKLNRKALKEPDDDTLRNIEITAPSNDIEAKLIHIWSEVLGVGNIGVGDNFFNLGGHSLKATVLISRVHKEFEVEIPLKEIFRSPTIKGLASYIMSAQPKNFISIKPADYREYYPLSPAQKRLYIIDYINGKDTSYNMPQAVMLEMKLDRQRVEDTFRKLIERHQSFRTSFEIVEGEPVQRIHDKVDFNLEWIEMNNCEDLSAQSCEKIRQRAAYFIRPFELKNAPLLRAGVIKLSEVQYILLCDMHHIISDASSMAILVKEFALIYQGLALPELVIQYKDFAMWQNESVNKKRIQEMEQYWLESFKAPFPGSGLAPDHADGEVDCIEGRRETIELRWNLVERVRNLTVKTGTTMHMLSLAAFYVLLSRYSGQEDITVGLPVAGRRHADLEGVIGMFVNTLALRNYPEGNKTFMEFLHEVRESALDAYKYQEYPLEDLINKLGLLRESGKNPLFEIIFEYRNNDGYDMELGGIKAVPFTLVNKTAKFDLEMDVVEKDGCMWCSIEYRTGNFKEETIKRMLGDFEEILEEIAVNPEIRIKDIELKSIKAFMPNNIFSEDAEFKF